MKNKMTQNITENFKISDEEVSTESLLETIKSIPRLLDEETAIETIPTFISSTDSAMEKFPDKKSHELILKLASKKVLVKRTIFERDWKSWVDLRENLVSSYRKYNYSEIENLEEKLKDASLGSYDEVTVFYEYIKQLSRDIVFTKCEESNWKNIFLIVADTETLALESFIEGLPTALSVFLMIKAPKTIENAYDIVIKRIKKIKNVENATTRDLIQRISTLEDQVSDLNVRVTELTHELEMYKQQEPMLAVPEVVNLTKTRKKCHRCHESGHLVRDCPKKLQKANSVKGNMAEERYCHSLGIETDMNDSRKFIFLVYPDAPDDMILQRALPEGTSFTKQQSMIKWKGSNIQSIGRLLITLDFGDFRVKKQMHVISNESTEMEDDGVLRQNFGQTIERNGVSFFTFESVEGMVEIQFGVDCPKKGKCKHYCETQRK